MTRPTIVDTGPVVALLDRAERRHQWTRERFAEVIGPLLTCEAVLTEADHLLRRLTGRSGLPIALLRRGALSIGMSLSAEAAAVERILERYADRPASLADACLVRMSEIHDGSYVLTFDSDFAIYRRLGRQVIPLLMP